MEWRGKCFYVLKYDMVSAIGEWEVTMYPGPFVKWKSRTHEPNFVTYEPNFMAINYSYGLTFLTRLRILGRLRILVMTRLNLAHLVLFKRNYSNSVSVM